MQTLLRVSVGVRASALHTALGAAEEQRSLSNAPLPLFFPIISVLFSLRNLRQKVIFSVSMITPASQTAVRKRQSCVHFIPALTGHCFARWTASVCMYRAVVTIIS